MESEIKNAVIKSATIEISRGFMLDSWIHLDYGGSGQGFGGFCLHTIPSNGYTEEHRLPVAGHWMMRVMQIAGVESWKDLPGKTIRVRSTQSKVEAIGHIVKEDWFNPSEDFAKMKEAADAAK